MNSVASESCSIDLGGRMNSVGLQLALNVKKIGLFAVLASSVAAHTVSAQSEAVWPKKTGVSEKGVLHSVSELHPDAVFAVEGHPDWLGVTEDAVWVSSSNVNHVVRLNEKSNEPDITISVEKPCSGLAVGFGSLWIPSCGAHHLVRVDQTTGSVQATIGVSPADSEGGITTGAGSVWLVTNASSELDRIDPGTNAVIARIALAKGSYNPVFAGKSVWISSNAGNALIQVDPATNKVVGSTPIGLKPRFLAAGAGSVWVLNQGDGTVSRVDEMTGKLLATIPAGIPGEGGEMAFGGGYAWATVFGYPITRIDPATNKVVQQWAGPGGDSIRFTHGSVWLTFLMDAKVWRLHVPNPSTK